MDARIGGVRKTSNGCGVAKRVPRKDAGFRLPSGNIAAIDFGTTHCSLAYVTVGDGFEDGPRRLPLNTTFYRVPTAILFTPDGMIHSFGYDARYEYLNLDDSERLEHIYFEQIKMDLQHDETVNREKKILGKNGKEYYLVDTIAQVLKYLKNELIENHLKRGGYPLEATDFDWVITVPAIWRARGKQMMREAGYKAGLCSRETCGKLQLASKSQPANPTETAPDKLSLALEPESAAIYCQAMAQQQLATYCDAAMPLSAKCYLVIDIGGGTVDISAHRISSSGEGHIEVVHPPTGNNCGGSMVNTEFAKFLEKVVTDSGFSRYLNTGSNETNVKHKADLNTLVSDTFEKQKILFGSRKQTRSKAIRLPYTFMETYKADLECLRRSTDPDVKLVGQDLRISATKMEHFFQPVVDGLLQCVCETLKEVEASVDTIYLVGGFGGSQYIYKAITDKLGSGYKYITPAEPEFAVVRGAVLYRKHPEKVRVRKVDATYGIDTCMSFNPSIHDPEYKWKDDDGHDQCNNIFCTIVERGDSVSTTEVYTSTFCPAMHQQKRMAIDIYDTQQKDVWYTTGRRGKTQLAQPTAIQHIGSLCVEMPILAGDKNRAVDVIFDFSHTEIQVKAYDQTSKYEVKTVLDFLSA